jgi:hypothetical protein
MEESDSNYREVTEQCVYGLTQAAAESLRDLTERGLKQRKQDEDYILRIDEHLGGTFDLIVLKRIN